MDKIDAGIMFYINKHRNSYLLDTLCMQYYKLEGEPKKQCYAKIKELLIETHGVTGLMMTTTSKSKYKI
jgi:hypothetical protein